MRQAIRMVHLIQEQAIASILTGTKRPGVETHRPPAQQTQPDAALGMPRDRGNLLSRKFLGHLPSSASEKGRFTLSKKLLAPFSSRHSSCICVLWCECLGYLPRSLFHFYQRVVWSTCANSYQDIKNDSRDSRQPGNMISILHSYQTAQITPSPWIFLMSSLSHRDQNVAEISFAPQLPVQTNVQECSRCIILIALNASKTMDGITFASKWHVGISMLDIKRHPKPYQEYSCKVFLMNLTGKF